MRVEQLECLLAVTRHGSLRRASEHLHLSQPALSESISRLERELGVVLLDRRRSGARISRDGRELLPHVEAVLDAVARLRASAGDRALGSRLLRLGTVGTATSTLLNPVLRALSTQHPDSRVEVVNARQGTIDDELLGGSLDLGLVNVLDGDDPPPGLVDTHLLTGPVVVVMPADHPLRDRTHVRIDDLRAEPFVKAMVADGAGLTFLPQFSVDGDALQRAGALVHRPLAGVDVSVHLVLRTRAQTRRTPHLERLHALMLQRAGELDSSGADDRIA